VPELVVVNKCDAAAPEVVERLVRREPRVVAVSAHSGAGVEELVAELAELLPRPDTEVDVLIPFQRGDLVHRVHTDGEVIEEQHTGQGTRLRARVHGALAAELGRYGVVRA
jgi:GTP-binding protein HflX